MTPDEISFVAAVCADPGDDTHRLVYADWLEERGRGERAEYIRDAIRLGWTGRCEGYRAARQPYSGDLPEWPKEVVFSRGFAESLTCDAASWIAGGDALSWHPSQTVECRSACVPNSGMSTNDRDPVASFAHNPWDVDAAIKCFHQSCRSCDGTGRIPRPTPPTAQPITHVALSGNATVAVELVSRYPCLFRCVISGSPVYLNETEILDLRVATGPVIDDPRIVKFVYERRWPGVTFTLPNFGPSDLRGERSRVERSGYARHLSRMFNPPPR